MLLLLAVATVGAREDKKGGRVGIPPQCVLAGSSDLQHRDLMGEGGILVSNGFEQLFHVWLHLFF